MPRKKSPQLTFQQHCTKRTAYRKSLTHEVESRADYLVTHNVRHLQPASSLGVSVVTPREFLRELSKSI